MANPRGNPQNLKPFKKGEPNANPGGKPVGARNRLSAAFLDAVVKDFEVNGAAALAQVRADKPEKYLELIAGLLPSESNVNVTADATVTHLVEPLSETAQWVGEQLRGKAGGKAPKSLPH